MQIGLIGLGAMGAPMLRRLHEHAHDVIGFDSSAEARQRIDDTGGATTHDMQSLIGALSPPRVIWLMLPAGRATNSAIADVMPLLSAGDLLIDGGNSDFKDASAHAQLVASRGIHFMDIGVSGGQWGWKTGYGITAGGSAEDFDRIEPVLAALAAPAAYAHVGDIGAGHLVKAVHNGVQYGVMQAYAEGFALLHAHEGLDSLAAMEVYQNGCSIRSFLLEQMIAALRTNPTLEGVSTAVPDSGMGRWTAEEAIRLGIPTPVLTTALQARFASRSDHLASRLLTLSRIQVGGQK